MFSVLVVEDEALERCVLVQQVREIFPDCGDIWETGNGIEALRLCQEKQPDVMLADINIPGISGLRLIELLRELGFSGGIVIATAYDRFGYLKKAMSLGVEGYLLKPVDEKELSREVRKCLVGRAHIKAEPEEREPVCSYAETYLVRDILAGSAPENTLRAAFHWPADGEIQARPLEIALPTEAERSHKDAVLAKCRALFPWDDLTLSAPTEQGGVLILQPAHREDAGYLQVSCWAYARALSRWAERECLPRPRILAGALCTHYGELSECYRAMGREPEPPPPDALCPPKERRRLRQRWSQRLGEGDAAYLTDMLCRTMGRPGALWPGVALLLEALEQADPTAEPGELLAIFRAENPFEAVGNWLSARFVGRAGEPGHRGAVARKGLAILDARHGQDISEQQVADELGLSQAYFSRLFKEETGESFSAAQTRVRMAHAKTLLRTGTESVRAVALHCGYPNYKYFLSAFKRETGLTTSQYQASAREGGDA